MLTGATLQRTAQRAQRVVEQAEHDGCYTWCGGEVDRGGDGQGLVSARLVRDDDDNDDVGWVGGLRVDVQRTRSSPHLGLDRAGAGMELEEVVMAG